MGDTGVAAADVRLTSTEHAKSKGPPYGWALASLREERAAYAACGLFTRMTVTADYGLPVAIAAFTTPGSGTPSGRPRYNLSEYSRRKPT
jgi:hypothetical protein